MAKLIEKTFPQFLDTSGAELIRDFFEPALTASVFYDRGVGYFCASWLKIAAKGMAAFARNNGWARWVTSPVLNQDDWTALVLGEAAKHDELIKKIIEKNIDDLEKSLELKTRSTLAWLVADDILEFRLALPRNKLDGEFHDKFGIFTDAAGNRVSFIGSYNDSIQGLRNYESIKIFQSWDPAISVFVDNDVRRFEKLWNNEDANVRVYELPEAAKEKIIKFRTEPRPYPEPDWLLHARLLEKIKTGKNQRPTLPEFELRDYQKDAVAAWFANGCRGFLEMATGTGKTITALSASVQLLQREKKLAVIIAVPYQHLVDQWHGVAKRAGYRPVLAYLGKQRWLNDLVNLVLDFNNGYRDVISVITTHATFIDTDFQQIIAKLPESSLLIADEAHHLGAEISRKHYPQNINYRMALSATPTRWLDDTGTYELVQYFGRVVFSYSLAQAIGNCLTPYYYYPHPAALTEDEFKKYEALSRKIAKFINNGTEETAQIYKHLLIKRSEILNNAINKLTVLSNLVDRDDKVNHTLFYCAPGQIDAVLKLLGWDMGLRVHRFTAREDVVTRQKLLADFVNGQLQALVAMKCLDEGVDVPGTRTAYFLASSSNPREFIQRRGRILRKYPGKEFSIVHDLITIPPETRQMDHFSPSFQAERSIIRKELLRFKEFANASLNKHQTLDLIWNIAKKYGLTDF